MYVTRFLHISNTFLGTVYRYEIVIGKQPIIYWFLMPIKSAQTLQSIHLVLFYKLFVDFFSHK